MNIWIVEANSGCTLLYKAFMELLIDEDLVSGLLTALNQLTQVEFKGKGIESIDMGGLRWVYVEDKDTGLLFIASATKDVQPEMLRARLNVIKQSFYSEFQNDGKKFKFNGNVEMFKPFKETIDEYYGNWLAAESVTTIAEFFDILGAFQQLFFDILAIVQHKLPELQQERIQRRIEKMFVNYRENDYVKQNAELSKISFSRESGINIITINPSNCDMYVVEKQLINLMKRIVATIKEEIGLIESVKYFVEEGIFDYLMSNITLLKQLNLDRFLLQLFLQE